MLRRAVTALILLLLLAISGLALSRPAQATELVMVEQQGCAYCIAWKKEIGPIYPKTDEGAFAPLRMIDIDDGVPADLTFARKVMYTPTFILIDNNTEVARIEGYPGEDFFWGLLNMMLTSKTSFTGGATDSIGDNAQRTNG